MKIETVSLIISAVGSVGAFIAGVVALFTLKELKKQRESSYKPALMLLRKSHKVVMKSLGPVKLGYHWGEASSPNVIPQETIPLINLGYGAAKNITLDWKFEHEKLLEDANKLAHTTHQEYFLKVDKQTLSAVSKGMILLNIIANNEQQQVDFLLPNTTNKGVLSVEIPSLYTVLTSCYLSLCVHAKLKPEDIKLPMLSLVIEFQDVASKKYNKEFRFECDIKHFYKGSQKSGEELPMCELKLTQI